MKLPWSNKVDEKDLLDKEIERVTEKLSKLEPTADGYREAAENLSTLMEVKSDMAKAKSSSKPSADAVLTVAGSIASVVIIVAYEHGHVLASKAANFVMKLRP